MEVLKNAAPERARPAFTIKKNGRDRCSPATTLRRSRIKETARHSATVVIPIRAAHKSKQLPELGPMLFLHGKDFAEAKRTRMKSSRKGLAYIDGYDIPIIAPGHDGH